MLVCKKVIITLAQKKLCISLNHVNEFIYCCNPSKSPLIKGRLFAPLLTKEGQGEVDNNLLITLAIALN